ncbi:MAG: SdpI family protein [Thermoplasmata archaeon]|nr:SdpI family protein [Thermoplasmata archaeon]
MITLMLSLIYLALAFLEYFVAPKVGPNPVFGFRVGYTFASRESWEKSNRFVGRLMLIHALLLLPLSLMGDEILALYLIAFMIPLVLIVPVGLRYASNILEMVGAKKGVEERRKMQPIRIEGPWLWLPLIAYVIFLAVMIITCPELPSVVATHFDAGGNPNGWLSREELLLFNSLIGVLPLGIAYLFTFLARRYPLYLHPGRMKFKRGAILKTVILEMSLVELMLILAYLGMLLYATKGENYINIIIMLSLIMVISPLIWLYTKGRESGGEKT